MVSDQRALMAYNAMRDLGIPSETVKPELEKLLKQCDNNWELVESENYRNLVDYIFENAGAAGAEEFKPPSKKPCLQQLTNKPDRTLDATYSKQPKNKLGFVHTSAENVPINLMKKALPGSLEASSSGNNSIKFLAAQSVNTNNNSGVSTCRNCTGCQGRYKIASLPSGEVEVVLNCKSALKKPNFHVPNLDSVLKLVEKKYLKSEKIAGSQFSVMKLLKDLCATFLQLGTNSSIILNPSPDTSVLERNKKASRIGNSEKESNITLNLVGVPQRPISFNGKRPALNITDITKGAERKEISVVNEFQNERMPDFSYIPQNIIYQNAYVHFSLARISDEDCCSQCFGDCLSSPLPCACARETGGEFAYTSEGLLKEDFLDACISLENKRDHYFFCKDCPLEKFKNSRKPDNCKGHLIKKFIKECWRKCGCGMQCGNRVVQRGITCDLQVFFTDTGKGWGLRTLQDLPKGTFVCEYVGEILTNTELDERNKKNRGNKRHTYPVLLDADWGSEGILEDEEALCLDATFYGNVARFINHRCTDANLFDIPVEVESPDRHYYHIAFFTKRKVDALEELTWDYCLDFNDQKHPIKAFQCSCGSAFCRDRNRKGPKLKGEKM